MVDGPDSTFLMSVISLPSGYVHCLKHPKVNQ